MKQNKTLFDLFELMALLKGVQGVLEVIAGIILLLVSPNVITQALTVLTHGELLENPQDYIATHLIQFAQHYLISIKIFFACYLLFHGIVKLFLVYGLLKEALTFYPFAIGIFLLLLAYEFYLCFSLFSVWKLALCLFDTVFIALIIYEYRVLSKKNHHLLDS